MEQVTLRDVALEAGVSPSTASRALNGGTRTAPEPVVAVVLAAAQRLGYVPDQAARALRGRRTGIIVLADDPSSPTTGAAVAAIERIAAARGTLVTLVGVGSDPAGHLPLARAICAMRPAAIVVTSSRLVWSTRRERVGQELQAFQEGGGNVVVTGRTDLPFACVAFADVEAGELAARHMASLGRRRFAILAGPVGHVAFGDRVRGMLDELARAGVARDAVTVEHTQHSRDGGYEGAMRLLSSAEPPDAILAVNDLIAIGALASFHEARSSVPAGIALIGIDGAPLARDVTPPLTTVAFPFEQVGEHVAKLVFGPVCGIEDSTVVHGLLVPRGTTRMPAASPRPSPGS